MYPVFSSNGFWEIRGICRRRCLKLGLALLAFASVLHSSSAQTLRGSVMDAAGAPIAGADVTVKTAAGSVSGKSTGGGTFQFDGIHVPAIVTARAADFADATASWDGATDINLTLHPAELLQEVIVTATRTPAPLAAVAASVSRISPTEIAASPALQLDDLLRQVPGFSLFRRSGSRTANPTSQGVSLRGLGASGASRALVLLDDAPLNDPFGGWVYWDRVPETDIRSLEVLRGGGSALYGSGALAGVISVGRPDFREHLLSLDFSGGEEGTANGSATASAGVGNWAVAASAQAMRTDGYIPMPPGLRGLADAAAKVRFGTGRFTVDRQFAAATAFASANLFNESRQNGTALQTNSTRLAEAIAGADVGVAGGALSLRAYGSGQRFNQAFSSIATDRNSESLVRVQAVPAQQFGASVIWNRELGTRNTIAVGSDFRRVTGHSDEVLWARNAPTGRVNAGGRQIYFGTFIEDMIRLGSRVHITAATRGDWWRNYDALSTTVSFTAPSVPASTRYADRDKAALLPSLGAVIQVSRAVSLTGSAYGAFRSPTLNELYRAFRLGNVQTLANDALRAERLWGGEAGVRIGSGPLFAGATLFWNTVHDAIGNRTLTLTPALITRQRQNIGSLESRGGEFELQAKLRMRIWLRLGYQFSDSKVANSLDTALVGLRIPQVPRHATSLALGYEGPRWSASGVGRYVGRQFDDDLNQFPMSGYLTADTMIRCRLRRGAEAYIAAENLLDRSFAIAATPVEQIGAPRLVRVGVRMRWPGNRSH
jgi:outer membrane receptor protein involved in Fe transport